MASLLSGHEGGSGSIVRVQALNPPRDTAATTAISVQSEAGSGAQGGSVAMNTSSSGLSLTPASIQGVGSSAVAAELSHVLSGLQQSGELSTVLQQQPHLVEELSVMASGEVTADPESLRFQYPLEDTPSVKAAGSKKIPPTVYREQDRFLPINNVSRVMRNAIPKTGKVSKDAKECMQECVSEFISFITSEAVDRCAQEKRKTVTGDDILYAMATLGFDNYIEPMKLYLQKIREYAKSERMANAALANSSRGRDMAHHPAAVSATLSSPAELQAPASVTSPYQAMQ